MATSFLALFAAILELGAAGCSGEADDAGACSVDPPGKTFTFHIHNGGSTMLRLTYSCGADLPIELDTAGGAAPIGLNDCALKCEDVYQSGATSVYPGCGDCGPGMGATLEPGATVDIAWDRRVYVSHTVDESCGDSGGTKCTLAKTVAAAAAQKGVLTVCADSKTPDDIGGVAGFCSGDEQTFTFTIDTTGDEGTIEVQ